MKKYMFIALTTVILVLLASESYSQVRFALGPKVGINFTSLSVDPTIQGLSGRTTILFGAAFELMFAKVIGVQIEPSYATKGASADNVTVQTGGGGTVQANVVGGYKEIQIPILFKAKFLDGPVKVYGLVGPNLGIVASAKQTYSPVQAGQFQEQEVDIKPSTSSLDFALDFGGGAEFRIAPTIGLTGDIRYSLGLSNLDNTTAQQGQVQGSTKTRGFQIMFGALFSL